jgi:PAS domain S-box-containing protein
METRKTNRDLEAEIESLRIRLEEAEETLQAIRNHEVDALVIDGPQGQQVFTLQGAEQTYRILMETMSEGALTLAADGTIFYCNSHFSELIGLPLNRIIGTSFHDFVIAGKGQSFQEIVRLAGETNSTRGEFSLKTAGGREVPVSLSIHSLMLGDMEGFCMVANDLTDQKRTQAALEKARDNLEEKVAERTAELSQANISLKEEIRERERAEEALRESEERAHSRLLEIEAYYASAPIGLCIFDTDLRYLRINNRLAEINGIPAGDHIGRTVRQTMPALAEQAEQITRRIIESGESVRNIEFVGETAAQPGFPRFWLEDWHPIKDASGRVTAISVAVQEITERKQAERELHKSRNELELRVKERTEELRQAYDRLKEETEERRKMESELIRAQKLEALGTLAGGIAHDFNNILAGIIGFTEMVLEDMDFSLPEHRRLELVLKGAHRGRDLVQQILAFSRRTEIDRKPLALSHTVQEALKLLRPTLPSTIEITSKCLTTDDQILADPGQIHQVLMNFCTNAAHAMLAKGGLLEITISDTMVAEGAMPVPEMAAGEYVVLEVSDTGCGMTPEIIDRIFDPFFTTKKQGEGTGLGLSVVHGIVENHGGYLAVESAPGKGSSFYVYLPKSRDDMLSKNDDDLPIAEGKERILLVDDEDILVELNKQRLGRLGYDVVATTSSAEALDAFRREPDMFDLVITDLTMPGMTGIDLAADLLKIRPTVPIILCTGHSETISPEQARDAGIKAYLLKPSNKSEMAKAIRQVLDTRTEE